MTCPACGCEHTKVIDSRPNDEEVIRRRECPECLTRWITQERLVRIVKPIKERRFTE
jgi:transcriptional repressor NrdR